MNTTNSEDQFSSAYGVATSLLMLERPITVESLERAVTAVGDMPTFRDLDLKRLKRELEANNNVRVGGYSVIDDGEFQAWVRAARETRPFDFWTRYKNWLSVKRRLPRDVIDQLDRLTDDILDRLRDPKTPGAWDRRGLVVGDVQSGKTGNYTALICKGIDAGYPLVIVLAGVHNSLRSQTQLRLDEGLLGFDTRLNLRGDAGNQRIGAGGLPGAKMLIAHSLTSSRDSGDFKRTTADGTAIVPGGKDPVILVVKKHVSILRNLIAWVGSVRGVDDVTIPGGRIIRDVPVLVIDDEADHASANTNEFRDEDGNIDKEADPTRTNELIRRLLTQFDQSAYVGYTATPFANVFIHHEAYSNEVGEDLFPRSFIINIPAPSNYIGAERVFGLRRPGETEDSPGLPIVREIDDADAFFPPKHKKDWRIPGLPDSLSEAILSFLLSCAARRARGDVDADNSMLIHVTRFTMVQKQVADLVQDELDDIRRQLEFPGSGGDALARLGKLWRDDYAKNAPIIRATLSEEDLPEVSWEKVRDNLFDAAKRITVRQINGSAKDALDYVDHPHGLSVIAVGGDKLSRGLTLEGLSVSYFVRTTKMYDTLMQMGRWFGYRPRYADLCRLYTSPELVKWYRHIAAATAELREEFDLVIDRGGTPLEFGHRVRTHPDGMLITAANKMRASRRVRAGFSGTISETVSFDTAASERNLKTFGEFLDQLPDVGESKGRYVWTDVAGGDIAALLGKLETSRDSWKANSRAMSDYVGERVSNGLLSDWTVVLIANGKSKRKDKVGKYEVRLTERANRSAGESGKFTIGRLVNPADELIDLNSTQRDEALANTVRVWAAKKDPKGDEPEMASGPFIRLQRERGKGLLLIYPLDPEDRNAKPITGFAVSFPFDDEAPLVDYAENSVKQLEDLFS